MGPSDVGDRIYMTSLTFRGGARARGLSSLAFGHTVLPSPTMGVLKEQPIGGNKDNEYTGTGCLATCLPVRLHGASSPGCAGIPLYSFATRMPSIC